MATMVRIIKPHRTHQTPDGKTVRFGEATQVPPEEAKALCDDLGWAERVNTPTPAEPTEPDEKGDSTDAGDESGGG